MAAGQRSSMVELLSNGEDAHGQSGRCSPTVRRPVSIFFKIIPTFLLKDNLYVSF